MGNILYISNTDSQVTFSFQHFNIFIITECSLRLEYQKDWMLVDIDWVLINGWLCFTWRWFYLPGNSQQLLQQRQQPAGGCCSRRCRGRPLPHACIHPFSSSYFAPIYSSLLWTRRPPTNYLGPQCTTCSAQLDRNPLYQLLIQGISHIWYKGIRKT